MRAEYGDGIYPLRRKLPAYLNTEWRKFKDNYSDVNPGVKHPIFEIFASFLKREADSLFADYDYQSTPEPNVEMSRTGTHAFHGRNAQHTTKKCRYLKNLERRCVARDSGRLIRCQDPNQR